MSAAESIEVVKLRFDHLKNVSRFDIDGMRSGVVDGIEALIVALIALEREIEAIRSDLRESDGVTPHESQ